MCGTVPTAAATLYTLLAPIKDFVKLQTIVESGAGGGALAGHEIGKTNGRKDVYLIRVRFDDRSFQTVAQASLDGFGIGDSVRIERDRVRRY
jgi:hypothetical protein